MISDRLDTALEQVGHWRPHTGGRVRFTAYPEKYPDSMDKLDSSGKIKKKRKKKKGKFFEDSSNLTVYLYIPEWDDYDAFSGSEEDLRKELFGYLQKYDSKQLFNIAKEGHDFKLYYDLPSKNAVIRNLIDNLIDRAHERAKEDTMHSPRIPPKGPNPYRARAHNPIRSWVGAENLDKVDDVLNELVSSGAVAMGDVAAFHDVTKNAATHGGYGRVDGLSGGDHKQPKPGRLLRKTKKKKKSKGKPKKIHSRLTHKLAGINEEGERPLSVHPGELLDNTVEDIYWMFRKLQSREKRTEDAIHKLRYGLLFLKNFKSSVEPEKQRYWFRRAVDSLEAVAGFYADTDEGKELDSVLKSLDKYIKLVNDRSESD